MQESLTQTTGEQDAGRETRHAESVKPQSLLGDVKLAARMLSISPKTVRRRIDAGQMPGICRLGRLLRLDLVTLTQWVAQGCPPLHRFVKGAVHD